jgi:shikimate kinase
MGSGKTSIGRLVADGLGVELIDGDEVLSERMNGRTAAEVADELGLDRLHELEAMIAVEALDAAVPAVIGPASSVCEASAVRDAMVGHTVVWLSASPELLAEKAGRKSHRPLPDGGDPIEFFRRQIAVREPLIAALDPLVVDVGAVDDDTAADMIIEFARARE